MCYTFLQRQTHIRALNAQIAFLRQQLPGNTVPMTFSQDLKELDGEYQALLQYQKQKTTDLQSRIDDLRVRYNLDHVPTPRSSRNLLASLEIELCDLQSERRRQIEGEQKQNAPPEKELTELESKEKDKQRAHELERLDRETSYRLELGKRQQFADTMMSVIQTAAVAGVAYFATPLIVGAAATTLTCVGVAAAAAVAYVGGQHAKPRKTIEAQAYPYRKSASMFRRLIEGPYSVEEPDD
ncbi:hypothetical protein CPB83DRAFT_861836 [Crepidotus variabilis]|uniref:Uncharacterized protein n=1 Tax=Crepidotus variabilis TaxID=179855 RepID=A0A9P6E7T8_9AGAR|nr:hypothetical protein CPB83DRAFT_861836 [Crepidotus variabilis]